MSNHQSVTQLMQSLGLAVATNSSPTQQELGIAKPTSTASSDLIYAPYFDRLKNMSPNWPIILDGPNGTGKTTAVHQLAAECGAELYVQQGYRTLAVEDMRGMRGLNEKGTTFEPGRLLQSLEDRKGWYILEEANMVDPAITALLHNLLDGTGEITVPELGGKVNVRENWRCFFTRNSGFAGTTEMNRALESRSVIIETDHFSAKKEIELITQKYPGISEHAEMIVQIAQAVRSARTNGEHEFEMDIRTEFQLADEYARTGDLLEAFSLVVLPKIGDRYSYGIVREALLEAVELITL